MRSAFCLAVLIIFIILTCQCMVFADPKEPEIEYFITLKMNGKSIGNFIAYERSGVLYLSADAYNAIGLPVTEDKPISLLEQYGKVAFDKTNQVIVFDPSNPVLFESKVKQSSAPPEIKHKTEKNFFVKSIDYQTGLYLTRRTQNFHNITITGAIPFFDFDLWLTKNQKSRVTLQHHDEHSSIRDYVTDIQLGYIPQIAANKGISITNEPYYRAFDFYSDEKFTLYYPVGTRVEIIRNGQEYVGSYTVYQTPLDIYLPLNYGSNFFKVYAYLPTGHVEELNLHKDINGFLVKPGRLEYFLAYGKEDITDKTKRLLRLSYGLKNNLTLSTQLERDAKSITAIYTPLQSLYATMSYFSQSLQGPGFISRLQFMDSFPVNFGITTSNFEKQSSFDFYTVVRIPYGSMVLKHSDLHFKTMDYRTISDRISMYISPGAGLFVSPYYELKHQISTTNKYKSTLAGLNSLYVIPRVGVTLSAQYEREVSTSFGTLTKHTLTYGIAKRIANIGELRIEQTYKKEDQYHSIKLDTTKFFANIYGFKYVSIGVNANYYHRQNQYDCYVTLSGSLSKQGFKKDSMRNTATVCFMPFIDSNLNGSLDTNEQIITSANITIRGDGSYSYDNVNSKTLCIDLQPYKKYVAYFQRDIDVEPKHKSVEFITGRGYVDTIYIPYYETIDIEGTIPDKKDGVIVTLVDNSGKVMKETKTSFGGYYLFSVPSYMKNNVKVIINKRG